MNSEHHKWLEELNRSILETYQGEQEMAGKSEHIQEVGHRVEAKWLEVLSAWLPPQYGIDTRKYLLLETEDGPAKTKETDIVVFHPHYPKSLRSKSDVLASGVAAAFSVKRTLTKDSIAQAFENAAQLRRGMKIRDHTLRHYLAPPVFYGLLAQSSTWNKSENAATKIKDMVDENDKTIPRSPREGLDFICVADAGCWSRKTAVLTEKYLTTHPALEFFLGRETIAISGMRRKYEAEALSPLTKFIGSLWQKLAINDPTLKPLADGLRLTDPDPEGGQFSGRRYKLDDLVDSDVMDNVRSESPVGFDWMYQY
ncbi:conserved hypothetical protein [Segniliparus rotundus DSM 44985]|uniref:DUF6602 domain-containing protein n=1 Tax=Segniliparus rotundus (strain ATCC BAA-972 / CDC 1076 / CIP 108378 / DSM 44985 / JCM 13578) TaxID=640132 RepID=D6ZEB5_SEGRD|nr:DUF6602 domain-containing protein [Segniliparus rotundus]ADG97395.1 conserved hypothetical protein [Segniliparus rotundus DSM 44985]